MAEPIERDIRTYAVYRAMTTSMPNPLHTSCRTALLALAGTLATASGACTTTSTVGMLRAPSAGEAAQLELRDGAEIDAHGDPAGSGRWLGPDGAAIDPATIASVERTRRGRGALEGAGIGALVGAGIGGGILLYDQLRGEQDRAADPIPMAILLPVMLVVTGAVGAGVGAIVGAIRGHRDVEVVDAGAAAFAPGPASAVGTYAWTF